MDVALERGGLLGGCCGLCERRIRNNRFGLLEGLVEPSEQVASDEPEPKRELGVHVIAGFVIDFGD